MRSRSLGATLAGFRVGDSVAVQRPDGRVDSGEVAGVVPPAHLDIRTRAGSVRVGVQLVKRRSCP